MQRLLHLRIMSIGLSMPHSQPGPPSAAMRHPLLAFSLLTTATAASDLWSHHRVTAAGTLSANGTCDLDPGSPPPYGPICRGAHTAAACKLLNETCTWKPSVPSSGSCEVKPGIPPAYGPICHSVNSTVACAALNATCAWSGGGGAAAAGCHLKPGAPPAFRPACTACKTAEACAVVNDTCAWGVPPAPPPGPPAPPGPGQQPCCEPRYWGNTECDGVPPLSIHTGVETVRGDVVLWQNVFDRLHIATTVFVAGPLDGQTIGPGQYGQPLSYRTAGSTDPSVGCADVIAALVTKGYAGPKLLCIGGGAIGAEDGIVQFSGCGAALGNITALVKRLDPTLPPPSDECGTIGKHCSIGSDDPAHPIPGSGYCCEGWVCCPSAAGHKHTGTYGTCLPGESYMGCLDYPNAPPDNKRNCRYCGTPS